MLNELAFIDALCGLERANVGDYDAAIPLMRKAAELMIGRGQFTYWIPVVGFLVQALLKRGGDGDSVEAEAAIAELAAAPVDGCVIRDVWLLRLRTLLANARGDQTAYRDLRDRCRTASMDMGYAGHLAWAEAMP
jgi:hypothetical protein